MKAGTGRQGYWSGSLAVLAVAVLVALGVVEILTRVGRVDQRLVTPVLFFQGADIPIHRISKDRVLRYELAPNTRYQGELAGRRYLVNVDEHGARYPTHPAKKAPGVFRIHCGGASTVYGAAVDDGQTIPAALERRLNASASPGTRYEAWNFGTSGYTTAQVAHLAHARLDTVDPDLVLVQLARSGTRAFLMPPSFRALDYPWSDILADPDLFEEHFEFWLPSAFAVPMLRHSAFARAGFAALQGFQPPRTCGLCEAMDRAEAQELSRAAEARGVPVVYYSIPYWQGRPSPDGVFPGLPALRFIDLYQPNREPDFYEIHPPPATLDELARLLIEALQARGLVRTAPREMDGSRPSVSPSGSGHGFEAPT